MQTLPFDLTAGAWVEILGGDAALSLQVKTAARIRLHFNASDIAPDLDAAFFLIDSFPPQYDFEATGQAGQSRIWARADSADAQIVVMRRA